MTFEGYTAGDEIGWSDESTVYAAVGPSVSPGENLVIKVRGYGGEEEGRALLEAARRQQKAVTSGCTLIAPVVAQGLANHACYTVLPRYPRTVLSLISKKVAVRPEGVFALSKKVLVALRELRDKEGRAHGNLKSSNILLTGTGRLRDSGVFLSDLSIEPNKDHRADLAALGLAVYQLVRRREVQRFDWPIAHSPEWAALGPGHEDARALCNAFLDPALATAPDPLAAAEAAFGKKKRSGGGGLPIGKLVAGAMAVLVLGGGGFYGWKWWKSRPASGGADHAEQQTSSSVNWVGKLAEELQRNRDWRSEDPYINEKIVQPLEDLQLNKSEITALEKNATPTGSESGKVTETVANVRAAFDAWEARNVVSRGYEDFAALGWTLAAGSIGRLRGDLSGERPVIPQLIAIRHAAVTIPEIQLKWRLLQDTFARLEKSADPVLSRSPAYFKGEAGSANNLDDLLANLNEQASRMDGLLKIAETGNSQRQTEGKFASFDGVVTAQVLRDWETDANRFKPAPAEAERLRGEWARSFTDLTAKIHSQGGDDKRLLAEVEQARSEAEASLSGLMGSDVEKVNDAVQARLAALDKQIAPKPPEPSQAPPGPMVNTPPPAAPGPASVPQPGLPEFGSADRDAFKKLLTELQSADFASATSGSMRALRDRFITDVKRSTSPGFQQEVSPFLTRLEALSFQGSGVPAAPALPGWTGPVAIPGGVSYTWNKDRLDFVLVPGEGANASFYLCANELPIGLLVDWIGAHDNVWAPIQLTAQPNVRGPRAWDFRNGGMVPRNTWIWPATLPTGASFYPPAAKTQVMEPALPTMPVNYVTAKVAMLIAGQFGCRLPTAEEWTRALRFAKANGWETGEGNLRDAHWEAQRAYIAGLVKAASDARVELRDPPWPDGEIFVPTGTKPGKGKDARPVTAADDNHVWFRAVNEVTGKPLHDMIGNVAEFLAESDGRISVAGGSALSPPEVDPATPYPLSPVQRNASFSDVGLRLALSGNSGDAVERNLEAQAFQKTLQSAPVARQ